MTILLIMLGEGQEGGGFSDVKFIPCEHFYLLDKKKINTSFIFSIYYAYFLLTLFSRYLPVQIQNIRAVISVPNHYLSL
jgi:hypothetical protein